MGIVIHDYYNDIRQEITSFVEKLFIKVFNLVIRKVDLDHDNPYLVANRKNDVAVI